MLCKLLLIVLCFFVLTGFTGRIFTATHLKEVRTIGDNRDDFLFSLISSAVMFRSGDVFISDKKQHFVAIYDKQGIFKCKIGRFGQGPSDFDSPSGLNLIDDILYVVDYNNNRIGIMDLDLKNVSYKRYDILNKPVKAIFLNRNEFIGSKAVPMVENARMEIVDIQTGKATFFFNEYPKEALEFVNASKNINKTKNFLDFFAIPIFAVGGKKKNVLCIGFQFTGNPVRLFLYNFRGEVIREFQYQLEPAFTFPSHWIDRSRKPPPVSHHNCIDSIHYYRDHFLVFIAKLRYKKGKSDGVENECLVFDQKGTFRDAFPVPANLTVFDVSSDGYLLAKKFLAEEEQLLIYKIQDFPN